MSTHEHYHAGSTDHGPGCDQDHSQKHHDHSSHSNRWLGRVMIVAGSVLGSYSLVVAGCHNVIDGVVHKLRADSENSNTARSRLVRRTGAGLLLLAGGVGLHFLEKLLPAEAVITATPAVFAAETAVNTRNTVKHLKSGSKTHETLTGLVHNGIDSITSFGGTLITGAAVATHSTSPLAEQIVGTGHVLLMSGLGAYSIGKATHLYRKEASDSTSETEDAEGSRDTIEE